MDPINPCSFYNNNVIRITNRVHNKIEGGENTVIPYKMKDLLNGPPTTWQVFRKQADVLDFISRHKCHLMGFAFESNSGRLFLSAHPEVYWHYDYQRPPNCRCSYEIIPENTACKLYFDLEYNRTMNPLSNGPRMVKNFIALVIFLLEKLFAIECKENYIINLDSTTESKFSRHLIFNIPFVCFANNVQAGNFVSIICKKIYEITETKSMTETIDNVTVEDISEMVVITVKGNKTLLCDESVYSRNRHFRLYKSTKFGKYSPLLLSADNQFVPTVNGPDGEKELFLNTLISYLPVNFEKLRVLSFENVFHNLKRGGNYVHGSNLPKTFEISSSPYKEVDMFISNIVSPGKIFSSNYFPSSKVISYNIIGNRYCGNIGRQHKSNNVKYIVDLKEGCYYQKCHDFECVLYRSEKKRLPESLKLLDSRHEDCDLGSFDVTTEGPILKFPLQRFPSCGLSDEDIINHLDSDPNISFFNQGIPTNPSTVMDNFPTLGLSDEDMLKALDV